VADSTKIYLFFRQRIPFAGLFLAAVAGIVVSDHEPDLWPIWALGSILSFLILFRISSSLLTYGSTLLLFGFWHGYQTDTDPGLRYSSKLKETTGTVEFLVMSEPQTDLLRLTCRFRALVKSIEDRAVDLPVVAECGGGPYLYGDEVRAHGKFTIPEPPANPGEFNYAEFLRRQNIYLEFRSSRGFPPEVTTRNHGNILVAAALALRHKIAATLEMGIEDDPEVVEIDQGMILGARGETSAKLKNLFQETGTIHLFAASGLQVALFGGLTWSLLRFLPIRRNLAALALIPIVLTYCVVTGLHPATVRATVMAILLAIGGSLERPSLAINMLAASGILILAYNTQQLFQIGFQLSFAAVFAIITLVSPGTDLLFRHFELDPFFPRRLLRPIQRLYYRLLFRFCESISLSVVCWMATAPILILWENHLSIVSIGANLVVVPLATMVMILGVTSMLVMPIISSLSIYLNNTCWAITKLILILLHAAASLPGGGQNVANPSAKVTDGLAILSEGTSHVCCIRAEGKFWLLNTGTPSQWERVTLPFLRYQGVNKIESIIATEPGRRGSGAAPLHHQDIPVDRFIDLQPSSDGAESNLPPNGIPLSDRFYLWSLSKPATHAAGLSAYNDAVCELKIGAFEILIISDLTEQTLEILPKGQVDIIYCAHTRLKKFPRDLLIREVSPQLLVLAGTKPEMAASTTSPTGEFPKWIFIKESGAVMAFLSGDDLLVEGFFGPQFRLRSRSR